MVGRGDGYDDGSGTVDEDGGGVVAGFGSSFWPSGSAMHLTCMFAFLCRRRTDFEGRASRLDLGLFDRRVTGFARMVCMVANAAIEMCIDLASYYRSVS